MRQILFLSLFLITIPGAIFAQSKESKIKLVEYKEQGVYQVDGENIVVTVVLENINGTNDEIFLKVKGYFARAYRDANSVIQTEDKAAGLIIGKGFYSDFFRYNANLIVPVVYSAYHVMRVDIKEGRVRVMCSANTWIAEWSTIGENYKKETHSITDYFPFTKKGIYSNKGKTGDAFVELVDEMHLSVTSLEKSLKEGGISGENEDW